MKRKIIKPKRKLSQPQEEHLCEKYCLGSHFPFRNEEERRRAYFGNKEFLFQRTKDPRRKEDHFFYTEREFPEAYFNYETPNGRKEYAKRYLVYDFSTNPPKVIGDKRTMWRDFCRVV